MFTFMDLSRDINSGLPQGSILGQVLLLIHFTDLYVNIQYNP